MMINVFIWRGDQQSQCVFGHRTCCCVFAVNYYAGFGFPLHGALGRANQSENWSVRTQDQVCGCSPSLRSGIFGARRVIENVIAVSQMWYNPALKIR